MYLHRFAFHALATALLATAAQAQSLSVSADVAKPGDNVDISYENRSMAGEEVDIELTDGHPVNPVRITITVKLDERGRGKTRWTVPEWMQAFISAPGARDAVLVIV